MCMIDTLTSAEFHSNIMDAICVDNCKVDMCILVKCTCISRGMPELIDRTQLLQGCHSKMGSLPFLIEIQSTLCFYDEKMNVPRSNAEGVSGAL